MPRANPRSLGELAVAAERALIAAARLFGTDCGSAMVSLDVYNHRVKALLAAARVFVAAEERRDLEDER